jgi:hypothetical protein
MLQKLRLCKSLRQMHNLFNLREGEGQAGMLAFPFAAAREREKLAERVSHRLLIAVFG